MKRLLLCAAAILTIAAASRLPAKADPYVDAPSFGRIVYGMTGGLVVLPLDAWQGDYPTPPSSPTTGNDAGFTGAPILAGTSKQYVGDQFGTPGSNTGYTYGYITGTLSQAVTTATVGSGVFSSGSVLPEDYIVSTKIGFVASYAWLSEVGVYTQGSPGSVDTLIPANTGASLTNNYTDTLNDPFAFKYFSAGGMVGPYTVPAFDYYSDPGDYALNSGATANQINHMLAYYINDASAGAYNNTWFIGFEDQSYDTSGGGHKRFDFNDTVINMTFQAVPEPAFFQLAGLLALGGFGLLRARRRANR